MDLSPELLAQLQQAIASGQLNLNTGVDALGRSPMRPRQLHNLTLLPTKDDPRPTFFWSAEPPRHGIDLTKTTEFPKLMWHGDTGQEITVLSKEAQAEKVSFGYVLTAPADLVINLADARQAAWDALSVEDQDLLRESIKQDKIQQLKAQLSALPADKLEALLTAPTAKPEPKRKAG
jgi:hypothetical protein